MVTNEERREVARKLRGLTCCPLVAKELELEYDDSMPNSWLWFTSKSVDRLADLIEPQPITGDTSDGYHTFDELYDHRAKLFSVVVRCFKDRAWKSKLHHDGTMHEGMFIVGVETPQGQATYHYDIDPYWDIFDCKELARAPEWDGHTPEQAIYRIASLRPSCDRDALLALADEMDRDGKIQRAKQKDREHWFIDGLDVRWYARRIREALGVPDECQDAASQPGRP